LIPVDSEHSALYQLLGEVDVGEVAGITLTASGGPFLNVPKSELCNATPQMALRHPTWRMGPKVTVDSANLMNKGLEVIEASWLFALPPSQIQVLIHPQSVVHSFLNLTDGTSLAQLSLPDMRIPIQYALLGRQRSPYPALALPACGPLSFEEPDPDRFPCLLLAYRAAQMGGTAPAVLSAADEEAVRLFLEGKICFTGIAKAVEATLDKHTPVENPTLEEVLAADAWGRQEVRIYWQASRE
jgi:1-deoxy-D-xylulose-5-phosphate reductoisomerase